jgi:hypothetical protein
MAVASREESPAPALDNYAGFIARLDAAAGRLTPRRDALATALGAAELLLAQNQTGLELWGQRLSLISQLLARHSGAHEARRYGTLRELHDVAAKMERMFTSRTQRIQDVCHSIRERRDQINTSLFELEKSRVKLTSSRMLALERETSARWPMICPSPRRAPASVSPIRTFGKAFGKRARQSFWPKPCSK